jgi:phospho-N-acetylmuramoyl-pentapeptide-transferase
LAGGVLGFLLFNYNPARLFMGDTGALALGGAIGACAILLKMPTILLVAGLLFVIEALSVILQISFFKLTKGKRLFKMAPIHHHFELKGWSEIKVVYVFWAFTLICCIAAYICLVI